MDWKAKLLSALRWVRDTVVYYFNLVVDPPAAAIKWYILAVLVVGVGGAIVGSTVKEWLVGATPVAQRQVYLIPKMPSVVTTVPPSASPKQLPPLKTIKAVEVAPKKVKRVAKKKAKCEAVFC